MYRFHSPGVEPIVRTSAVADALSDFSDFLGRRPHDPEVHGIQTVSLGIRRMLKSGPSNDVQEAAMDLAVAIRDAKPLANIVKVRRIVDPELAARSSAGILHTDYVVEPYRRWLHWIAKIHVPTENQEIITVGGMPTEVIRGDIEFGNRHAIRINYMTHDGFKRPTEEVMYSRLLGVLESVDGLVIGSDEQLVRAPLFGVALLGSEFEIEPMQEGIAYDMHRASIHRTPATLAVGRTFASY